MSLRRSLSSIQTAILRRPGRVLLVSGIAVLVALVLATGVEFRSSRNDLAPPDDPDQQRWNALLDDYAGAEALIACVEARAPESNDPTELERFVDRLADRFASDPRVDYVFHRFDLERLVDSALYLVPPDSLSQWVEGVEAERDALGRLLAAGGLAEANDLLADRIETELAGATDVSASGKGIELILVRVLEEERAFLEAPVETLERWTSGEALRALAPDGLGNGYLTTRDTLTYFMIISPRDRDDSLPTLRDFLAGMRVHAEAEEHSDPRFRVAFTGTPAISVEEMDTVRADTWRTSFVAITGVTLLTLLVFRWRSHALLVLTALVVGIVWALGAVKLELGYLNLIASASISTLIGVGVAYGIHPVSEYELEGAHSGDPVEAVRKAYHRTGTAVTVAGATTAAAFFSILLMRHRGFAELGLVAGVGVLLCLVAAMVTLPALLVVHGERRRARERAAGPRRPAVVDWFWVERVSGRICSRPRLVTLGALGVTVVAGWLATGLRFNTNLLELLPRDAESLHYQRRMVLDSDFSPIFSVAVAPDLEALAAMRARAEAEPTIARFESVLRVLPDDPQAARAWVGRLQRSIEGLAVPEVAAPLDRNRLRESLTRLEEALAEATDAAFNAGMAGLVGSLERARSVAEESVKLVERASPAQQAAWDDGQRRLLEQLRVGLARLQRMAAMPLPTAETIPGELRTHFFTRSGKPLAFLFPTGDVFEPSELPLYVAASRRVWPEATGFPIVFEKMSREILDGFQVAVIVGAVVVILILLVDFRSARDTALALVPLVLGVIWMMGGMRLLGFEFNFANLVAVPLIIGVGIDNGVHVIQRVRLEGRDGMTPVLRHTGRAILIASLTTMVGFGSLVFASHLGMRSLGAALLLGVGACLVTSTIVLPNLLVALGLVEE